MLENVPPEILQQIFLCETLDFRDLINTASTCSYLKSLILPNNPLWKAKYAQKWPTIYESSEPSACEDYYAEVQLAYKIRSDVRRVLINFATNCSHKEQLSDSDFKPFMEIIITGMSNGGYITEYVKEMLFDDAVIDTLDIVPIITPGNLTLKYYCLASLRFLRQLWLTVKWDDFFALRETHQTLDVAATMLTQWCKPQDDVKVDVVLEKLDAIADDVKAYLKEQNPSHPLFQTAENVQAQWRRRNIFKNQFSTEYCQQILSAMNTVLCNKMDYCGNETDYYHINNSFITEVLKTKRGLPITLSIIYESIARRLGVNLDPISSPAHFLLRFTEEDTEEKNVFYVDVFNKGRMYSSGVCAYSGQHRPSFVRATTRKVIERMSNNIEVALRDRTKPIVGALPLMRAILEFNDILQPNDINTIVYLARFYMTYGMDTEHLEHNLLTRTYPVRNQASHILKMLFDYKSHMKSEHLNLTKTPALRTPDLTFAVGMVMKHKLYDYTCVIYGWDHVCKESVNWQKHMRVNQLKNGANQPFYHVLVEDGSKRYTAQENLEPTSNPGALCLNEDIGRFFSHYYKNLYVPNAVKQAEYPEDVDIRKKFHLELLES